METDFVEIRSDYNRSKKKRNSQECTASETGAKYEYEYIYNSVQIPILISKNFQFVEETDLEIDFVEIRSDYNQLKKKKKLTKMHRI